MLVIRTEKLSVWARTSLAVREAAGGPVLGCRDCGHAFGPAGDDPRQYAVIVETPIAELSPVNGYADGADVVLHQYCCAGCGTFYGDERPLKLCTGCQRVRYCDRRCQQAHWKKAHRDECRSPHAIVAAKR